MTIDFPDGWGPDEVAAFAMNAVVPLTRTATPLFDRIERVPAAGTTHHYTENHTDDEPLQPDEA